MIRGLRRKVLGVGLFLKEGVRRNDPMIRGLRLYLLSTFPQIKLFVRRNDPMIRGLLDRGQMSDVGNQMNFLNKCYSLFLATCSLLLDSAFVCG